MRKLFAIWRILCADKFALFTFENVPDDPEWQTAPYFRWRLSHDDGHFLQLIKNVVLNIERNNNENRAKTNEMEDAVEKIQAVGKAANDIFRNGCSHKIKVVKPIGYLEHEPTGHVIYVYKPISCFKALMLRWCFELKYKKI